MVSCSVVDDKVSVDCPATPTSLAPKDELTCTASHTITQADYDIWRAHFGTGIVDTPSNFGIMGERPSDPELLEYLAKWFIDNGM